MEKNRISLSQAYDAPTLLVITDQRVCVIGYWPCLQSSHWQATMEELDNRAHLNVGFLKQRFCMPALFMRCAFPIAAVIAGELDFIWMTATVSEPDQSYNYHSLKLMACAFFQLHQIVKKEQNMEENHKKQKNHELRNRECAVWRADES